MNVLKIQFRTFKFIEHGQWKRKLRMLDAMRPRLIRSEYIKRVEEMGFKIKDVKVVYNVINEYIALDDFSMYPEDNINNYYLKDKSDLPLLLERICKKLKISANQSRNKTLLKAPTLPLTVIGVLTIISEL
jgi:hypothetical protein